MAVPEGGGPASGGAGTRGAGSRRSAHGQASGGTRPEPGARLRVTRPTRRVRGWCCWKSTRPSNARGGVVPAGNFESQNALATDQNSGGAYPVAQGIYDPATDASRNVAAQSLQPTPAAPAPSDIGVPPDLGRSAAVPGRPAALEGHDRDTALKLFRDAWKYERELDPETRQQLQDKLILLQTNGTAAGGRRRVATVATRSRGRPATAAAAETVSRDHQRAGGSPADERHRSEGCLGATPTHPRSSQRVGSGSRLEETAPHAGRSQRGESRAVHRDEQGRHRVGRTQSRSHRMACDWMHNANRRCRTSSPAWWRSSTSWWTNNARRKPSGLAKQAHELAPDAEVTQNSALAKPLIRRMQEQLSIDEKKEQGFYDAMTSVDDRPSAVQ